MKLKPTFIDVETFWSKTHSLSKMSPLEYVMHPDTEIQMFACKFGRKANTDVLIGEGTIRTAVSKIDWSDKFVIAHNMSGFDALVLAWRLGIRPAMWGCTLAMARPIHAKTTGLSLAKLVQHHGIGTKNQQALIDTCGKRLADFTADELRRMETYNGDDTDQCAELFYKLVPHYTTAELWHIDAKIRALVEPKFELDMPLLRETLAQERLSKHEDLMELADLMEVDGVDEEARAEAVRAQLASSAKFAELLTSLGAEVPMKESTAVAGKMIPAVSKTDEGMKELLDSPSHLVAAAARGRLAVKSTILETRLEAFIQAGEVTGGKWPVTAHYCGADTTGRPSGWLYNPLNLPRVNPKAPKRADALRNSIRAPKDHVVVVSDSSGIELRFNHFLWMVPYSTQLWSQKADADLYRASAARMYSVPPEEVSGDQRQFHKVLNLACGYGMGPPKFRTTARNAPGGKDIPVLVRMPDGSEVEVYGDAKISEVLARTDVELVFDEAREGVYGWRKVNKEIVDGWQRCGEVLEYIAGGREVEIDPWGLFVTCAEGIRMPSGRLIRYPDLRLERDEKTGKPQWVYGQGRHMARLYGGKVDENLVQAGARDVIYDIALEVYRASGFRYSHEVYDELAYVVPKSVAEDFLKLLQDEMRKPTKWFPALIKWSEGDIAECYGAAK